MGLRFEVDGETVRVVGYEPMPEQPDKDEMVRIIRRVTASMPKSKRESSEMAGAAWYPWYQDEPFSADEVVHMVAAELYRIGYRLVKVEGGDHDYTAKE